MLNQRNIDTLMSSIQNGFDTYIYYIAHRVECREGAIDEFVYKADADFIVLKLKLKDIRNAYFELQNFKNYPDQYHTESEETYEDEFTKYVRYYNVPNGKDEYSKDFNPRLPSAIYGYRRRLYRSGILVKDYTDDSPVKEVFTNALVYGDLDANKVLDKFNQGKLDWKYKKLEKPVLIDAVVYKYITSDWYILDIENFPRTEMPLINVKQKTAYFMSNTEAQSVKRQLKA